MLDVHAPHEPLHGWRDFLIHITTITIGLLIALGLEAVVEHVHHSHQVVETKDALDREFVENKKRFAEDTRFFRDEAVVLQADFAILQLHPPGPSAPANQPRGAIVLRSSYARMEDSAWKTAQATSVTSLMSQGEVQKAAELYGFFERMDRAHEEEADAIASAYSFLAHNADPSRMTYSQRKELQDLLTQVFAKHLRHGFLMQNLAEEYPEFRPAPSREELESGPVTNK